MKPQYWTIERKTAATHWRFLLRGTELVARLYYDHCLANSAGQAYRLLSPGGAVVATSEGISQPADSVFHLKLRRLALLWQGERKARASP